jgi:hypothetical protein
MGCLSWFFGAFSRLPHCVLCAVCWSISMSTTPLMLTAVCVLLLLSVAMAWNEWMYKTTWATDPNTAASKQVAWDLIWGSGYDGISVPPRPRRGHSLHLITTDERSDFKGATYLVLFGGRDNDQQTTHIPKTYDVISVSCLFSFLQTNTDNTPLHCCYC